MAFSQLIQYPVDDHTVTIRHAKYRDADDATMFPNFFEKDFSIATATGFIRVWDGTYVMLKYLQEHRAEYFSTASGGPHPNCVELGAGSGLLGICVAAMGANVLLSDVKSSVDCITRHNIVLNDASQLVDGARSEKAAPAQDAPFFVKGTPSYVVGSGRAAALPIDWAHPEAMSAAILDAMPDCDLIIACDCIWLPDLLKICVGTAATLFRAAGEKLPAREEACNGDSETAREDGTAVSPASEEPAPAVRRNSRPLRALFSFPHLYADPKCSTTQLVKDTFAANGLSPRWLLTQPADPTRDNAMEISLWEVTATPLSAIACDEEGRR